MYRMNILKESKRLRKKSNKISSGEENVLILRLRSKHVMLVTLIEVSNLNFLNKSSPLCNALAASSLNVISKSMADAEGMQKGCRFAKTKNR